MVPDDRLALDKPVHEERHEKVVLSRICVLWMDSILVREREDGRDITVVIWNVLVYYRA